MSGRLTVVGLGPAGPELAPVATIEAIAATPPERRFLRTARHPSASLLEGAQSFDAAYESSSTFEETYRAIVESLLAEARGGDVLYAVPGSPRVLERTVDLLLAEAPAAGVEVLVLPALSFLDLAWAALGVDPVEAGVRLVDGHRFALGAAGEQGPLLVAHTHNRRVLSDLKLAFDDETPPGAVVLHHLGLPDEAVVEVEWADLDRALEPDHLTCVWVPEVGAPVAAELVRFDELVRTLRERCPWDREQTHRSLTRFLVEEAYEVLDAVDTLSDDESEGDEDLEEELGDLLFQVVLHAAIARERGSFTLADVARGIHDKLHARHPHVFGDEVAETPEAVASTWEERKRAEKGRSSVFEGIPRHLPALLYAAKVLRKAEGLGVHVEPAAGIGADELGEALLGLVGAARAARVDPEVALRRAADRVVTEAVARET